MLEDQSVQRLTSLTAETFWASLAEFMAGKNDYFRDHPWMIDFTKVIYTLPHAEFDEAFRARIGDHAGWLQDTLLRGQELGLVRTDLPAESLARLCFSVGEAFDRWLLQATPSTEELVADLDHLSGLALDLMRRLVAAPNYPASKDGIR